MAGLLLAWTLRQARQTRCSNPCPSASASRTGRASHERERYETGWHEGRNERDKGHVGSIGCSKKGCPKRSNADSAGLAARHRARCARRHQWLRRRAAAEAFFFAEEGYLGTKKGARTQREGLQSFLGGHLGRGGVLHGSYIVRRYVPVKARATHSSNAER